MMKNFILSLIKILIIILSWFSLLLCLIIDMEQYEKIIPCLKRLCDDVSTFLENITDENLNYMQNMFQTTWSVAVTIAIFIFGLSKEYSYGITFKQIVNLKIGKTVGGLCVGFLLLCPFFYICISRGDKATALWIVIVNFLSMVAVICFTFWYTRRIKTRDLIRNETKNSLIRRLESTTSERQMKRFLDSLQITSMIEHVDYSNEEELSFLLETLVKILKDEKIQQKMKKSSISNTLILSWISRIIMRNGISTEFEKRRAIEFCVELYNGIEKEEYEEKAYALQMLIPFLIIETDDSYETMMRLWKRFVCKDELFPYLLLYTQFHKCCIGRNLSKWLYYKDEYLKQQMNFFYSGKILWDKAFAKICWLDWSQYDYERKNPKLYELEMFFKDIECLWEHEKYILRAGIIREIGGIIN